MPLFPLRAAPLAGTEKFCHFLFTIFHKCFHRFQQLEHDCAVVFIICGYQLANRYRIHCLLQRDSRREVPLSVLPRSLPERALPQMLLPLLFICHTILSSIPYICFFRPADNLIHRPLRQVPLIRH